jgi:exoribonuclease-2
LRTLAVGDLVGIPSKPGGGEPQIAIVRALQGSRAHVNLLLQEKALVLPTRQLELLVSSQDLAFSSPSAAGDSPSHFTTETLQGATPRRRDLGTAWVLLLNDALAESPSLGLSLAAFTELVCGRSDPLHRCACWLWLQGPQTLFRLKQGLIQPRSLQDLRKLRQERHHQQRAEAERSRWREALRRRATIDPQELSTAAAQDLAELRLWASGQRELSLSAPTRQLLLEVHCSDSPAEVRHLLADMGLWPRHHLPALQGTSWQKGFSVPLLGEAEALLQLVEEPWPGDGDRLDLTGLRTVTIDDDDTVDIDDALSLDWRADGAPQVWIHIADPGRLIAEGSPLDLEARRRATSLYLAQGTLPMFPEILATGPLSLRAGQRCAAWSLRIDLDEEGAIAGMQLHRSWVRPTYRLSYDDADELLELAPPQEKDLLTLQDLMQSRRAWRERRGALFLDQPEGRIRHDPLNPGGDGAVLEITEPTASRQMVAEAMILAGAAIAEYGREHQLALPYRSQPVAPVPALQDLEALPVGPVRLAAIRKGLTRGQVGSRPAPHFSLGLEAYVQATSPIRRYGDLLVQRQLAAHLEGRTPLDEGALLEVLTAIEGGLREGMAISREDHRHWQQVWFAEHRSDQWRGLFLRWLREDHQLALVHVESLAMDLPAHCQGTPKPGDGVLLRVREVDPLRDLLRLEARAR